jgi:hypothetical protein
MIMKYKELGKLLSKEEMKNVKGGQPPTAPNCFCSNVADNGDPIHWTCNFVADDHFCVIHNLRTVCCVSNDA